jgi:hypothetical protein
MHEIEPFYRWENLYTASADANSPFYRRTYDYTQYTYDIYGYYIHPSWDYIGSDTLFIKILFASYTHKFAIIELFGEWNDAITNDIMYLKHNVINKLLKKGISQFILIGENVLNFHGSDDCYYEEWFEDVEDGWIAAVNFRDFVRAEWKKYNIDTYINFGGNLDIENWRTMQPLGLYNTVKGEIVRRLN